MLWSNPSMSEYDTNQIIRMLDENYSNLTNIKVALLTGNENKKFTMNLIKKLYDCGCQVTIISSTLNYYTMREAINNSDVCMCFFNNNEINETIHPNERTFFFDFTGHSFTEEFKNAAKANTWYTVYTAEY